MKVTRYKPSPDEKFLGSSGVVIPRGLAPSKQKQDKNSKKSSTEESEPTTDQKRDDSDN